MLYYKEEKKTQKAGETMEFERRCWAEIDLGALRHNFKLVQQTAAHTPVMAVIKADAYGHGDVAVAQLLCEEGAAAFAVSGLEEALRLRRAGIEKPILILGYTGVQNAAQLAQNHITQTVYCAEYAQALSAAAQAAHVSVTVHIKLDTGMGRLGFDVRDTMDLAVEQVAATCALPGLCVQGAFTHFAVADSESAQDKAYTQRQHAYFLQAIAALEEKGIVFETLHCSNSAGIAAWPSYHHTMVRAGIILYGENPSGEVALPGLRPALQVKAAVSLVKNIPAGAAESYGCTFVSTRPMRVATLAVGYADGYPRALSGTGTVSLHGKKAKVLGRVCMDQIIVDVSDIPQTKMGDIATVCGGDIADSICELAALSDTINYEVLCDIGRRVPRVYVENGQEVHMVNYLREG